MCLHACTRFIHALYTQKTRYKLHICVFYTHTRHFLKIPHTENTFPHLFNYVIGNKKQGGEKFLYKEYVAYF